MVIVASNNLRKHIPLPDGTIIRINLAWYETLEILERNIQENNIVMLDYPSGRTKPPANRYLLDELRPLMEKYPQIVYLAISNIDAPEELEPFLSEKPQIVPKIESVKATENIEAILQALPYKRKMIMLDHEDMHHDLLSKSIDPGDLYSIYVKRVEDACLENKTIMLKTAGILFSG